MKHSINLHKQAIIYINNYQPKVIIGYILIISMIIAILDYLANLNNVTQIFILLALCCATLYNIYKLLQLYSINFTINPNDMTIGYAQAEQLIYDKIINISSVAGIIVIKTDQTQYVLHKSMLEYNSYTSIMRLSKWI